jgi:hypothetical protein
MQINKAIKSIRSNSSHLQYIENMTENQNDKISFTQCETETVLGNGPILKN